MLALSPIFTQTGFSQAHDIMYTHTYMYCSTTVRTYAWITHSTYSCTHTYMGKGSCVLNSDWNLCSLGLCKLMEKE